MLKFFPRERFSERPRLYFACEQGRLSVGGAKKRSIPLNRVWTHDCEGGVIRKSPAFSRPTRIRNRKRRRCRQYTLAAAASGPIRAVDEWILKCVTSVEVP